jgi:hypothetical protein
MGLVKTAFLPTLLLPVGAVPAAELQKLSITAIAISISCSRAHFDACIHV